MFLPDGYEQTYAELPADIKNSISHRKRAIALFSQYIHDNLARRMRRLSAAHHAQASLAESLEPKQ